MRKDIELLNVSDEKVLQGFKRLCRLERKQKAQFLAYLNIIEERKLFAGEGYSSLVRYLVEFLNYSESSALKRIQVARLAKRLPKIYFSLEDGEVSLSAIERVAPHIKKENAERLLNSILKKSVREVEALLAREFPKPDAKDRCRPLSEDKYLVQFTATQYFMDNLEEAKALLCRKYPTLKLADILGEALKFFLDAKLISPQEIIEQEPEREQEFLKAIMENPEIKNSPRYIPRGIRREVLIRDKRKCQFKKPDGTLCGETKFLEFDHVFPWALGGSSHSASNIRLLCRTHNMFLAAKDFPAFFKRAENFPP